MIWNYIFSFSLGVVGALFIVWLRWIDALPRFKSAIEIEQLETEYKNITEHITKTLEENKNLENSNVKYSNDLRDDIWRQRMTSFLISAFMYVLLGGATALIFVGLDAQNVFDTSTIIKLIAAGALWSSFYSFIDVKNADKYIKSEQEKLDQKVNKKRGEIQKENKELTDLIGKVETRLIQANKDSQDLTEKYNSLVDEYENLQKQVG